MRHTIIALTLAAALGSAAPAHAADWLLTPYLGVTFGGDTPDQQVNYGLSAAVLGAGVFGLEVDAAITPNFFDAGDNVDLEDSNVSTFMVNLMLGDLRYFRSVQDSDGGDDIDIDLGGFNFWRGTLGVTFRF